MTLQNFTHAFIARLSLVVAMGSLLLSGCRVVDEVYLYREGDDEWQRVKEIAEKDCRENSRIWKELRSKSDFSHLENNSLYQVDIDNKGSKSVDFIRIDSVTSNTVAIRYSSEYSSELSRVYEFRAEHQEALIGAIANGVCSGDEKYRFASSGLNSSSAMTFTQERKHDSDDEYSKYTDVYTVKTSLPLLFIAWNRTETLVVKESGKDPKAPRIHKISVKAITQKECEEIEECNEIVWGSISTPGSFKINPNAYREKNPEKPESVVLELRAGGDS